MVIDGGNTYFKDDVRRARELAPKGIHYVDVGTSGGVWGLERGYCLMIGGEPSGRRAPRADLRTLAPARRHRRARRDAKADRTAEQGYLHCGPAGAGHFVKMIHNGIEYGLMQAYRRGLRHPAQRADEEPAGRAALSTSISPTSPRSGAAAAW